MSNKDEKYKDFDCCDLCKTMHKEMKYFFIDYSTEEEDKRYVCDECIEQIKEIS